MKRTKLVLTSGALLVGLMSSSVQALDWRLGIGGHDYYVDEADSHTFGAQVHLSLEYMTQRDILLSGKLNIYIDNDVDELDPDHIPIWFSSEYAAEGELFRFSPSSLINWDITVGGKRNTVSSVEKQLKFFPTIGYQYHTDPFSAGIKVGPGYYFLEIDDDVPRTRGYDREDFQNKTGAYTVSATTNSKIGSSFDLGLSLQHWNDGSAWLENEAEATLSYDANEWRDNSLLIVSLKYTEYNLDPYARDAIDDPDYLPILPWNKDLLVQVSFNMPWG